MLSKNGILARTYATVSSSGNFLIQLLLTTVHSFLYVRTRFRIFRIATRANWNSYYNINNVPTKLYLSRMKRISGLYYFLHLFPNSTPQHLRLTALSLCEYKLFLEFDWSIQVTWKEGQLVNQICFSKRFVWAYSLLQQHESWLILQMQMVYFFEVHYYRIILSYYLHLLAEVFHNRCS